MKVPNQATVDNLQASTQMLAHFAEQFAADVRQLKALGLGWLAKCVKGWYSTVEGHRRIFLDRILFYDTDPAYDVGSVVGMDSVDGMLGRTQTWIGNGLDQLKGFRRAAWDSDMGYTSDLYEHLIRDFEKIGIKIQRERALIKKLGEPGYIGSRLEDE